MTNKPSWYLLLLSLIVSVPFFAHLDAIPMQLWDESRLANHVVEMIHSNNWIVTKFQGLPDTWSTKPPLMEWIQALLTKLLGFNELAIRLPSAVAALGTSLLVFWLFAKYKEPLLGFIAGAILCTVPGYVGLHGTRTGEYDSLLTFFMTGYALFFFLYLEENNRRYLLATFALLTFAALTKGVQGLLFLPAMFIWAIYKKQVLAMLKQKELYAGIAAFLFLVIGYYLLREHYDPGYLKWVRENEIGGRFNKTLENHTGDEWYYYNLLVTECFHDWYLLVIPGIVVGLFSKQEWLKRVTLFSTLLLGTYFFVINNGQTKLGWYMMPLYPFLTILVAVFVYGICKLLDGFDGWRHITTRNIFPYFFLFFVLIIPYRAIVSFCLSNRGDPWAAAERTDMEQLLMDVKDNRKNIDGCAILSDLIEQNQYWYYKLYEQEHRPIVLIEKKSLVPGTKLVVYRPGDKKYVEEHFNTEVMRRYKAVTIYQLGDKK